jgi:hypothetical protein
MDGFLRRLRAAGIHPAQVITDRAALDLCWTAKRQARSGGAFVDVLQSIQHRA